MSCVAPQPLGSQSISVFKGQSRTYHLLVREDPGGLPANLTGATVFFTIKKNLTDANAVVTKSSVLAVEILLLDQVNFKGQADIFLLISDTVNLAVGEYVYDVWVELGSGKRFSVIDPSLFTILTPVTTVFT